MDKLLPYLINLSHTIDKFIWFGFLKGEDYWLWISHIGVIAGVIRFFVLTPELQFCVFASPATC